MLDNDSEGYASFRALVHAICVLNDFVTPVCAPAMCMSYILCVSLP